MPAVRINPALPTLYLDWSHVSSACESGVAPGSQWVALMQLLAAGRANVCLSTIHLLELLAWPDHQRSADVARLIDELPVVWMESAAEKIEIEEAKSALLRALGASVEPYAPFLGGFVQLFQRGLRPNAAAEMLARATVSAFLKDTRGRNMGEVLAYSIANARDFALDRKRASAEGFRDEEMMEMVASADAYNRSVVLERAHKALLLEDGYRQRGLSRPAESEIAHAIRQVIENPRSLPAFQVTNAVHNAFALRIREQDPASRRFERHQSAWFDMLHCGAGAAYCDVFTCDARTALDIGDLRARFGFQPPITEHGASGPEKMVRAIEDQLRVGPTRD
jgi:predicted transcriptional regulator